MTFTELDDLLRQSERPTALRSCARPTANDTTAAEAAICYDHIASLIDDNALDWEMTESHWMDLLRTSISSESAGVVGDSAAPAGQSTHSIRQIRINTTSASHPANLEPAITSAEGLAGLFSRLATSAVTSRPRRLRSWPLPDAAGRVAVRNRVPRLAAEYGVAEAYLRRIVRY